MCTIIPYNVGHCLQPETYLIYFTLVTPVISNIRERAYLIYSTSRCAVHKDFKIQSASIENYL